MTSQHHDRGVHRSRPGTRRAISWAGGLLGLLGGLSCAVAMILPALGIAGATAAATGQGMGGMNGMDATETSNAVLALLQRVGPELLVISAVLVVLGLGLRRPWLVIPALAAAALMYWGMYLQTDLAVMYTTSGLGLLTWMGFLLATRRSTGPSLNTPPHRA